MRIGFACDLPEAVAHGDPYSGPVPSPSLGLLVELRRKGVDVVVLTLDRAARVVAGEDTAYGFRVAIPVQRTGGAVSLFVPRARRISEVARELGCDVLHGQGLEREYGLASTFYGSLGIATVHGIISEVLRVPGVRTRIDQRLLPVAEKLALSRARNLVSINDYVKDKLHARTPARWFDIPNAVDPRFLTAQRCPQDGRILLVGSVYPLKGIDDAIRALGLLASSGHENVELHVVGGAIGSGLRYQRDCERLARQLGIADRVRFHGWASPEVVMTAMSEASVLVVPSAQESAPMCVAEAACIGIPVCAYDVGGVRGMLLAQGAGHVVPQGDWRAMAESISTALQGPGASRSAVVAARATYNPGRVADLTIAAYETLLGTSADTA